MALQFVMSCKMKPKLILDGFVYFKEREYDAKTYWRCEMCNKSKCKVRVIAVSDTILSTTGTHNHVGDASHIEALLVEDGIRQRAIDTQDASQDIVNEALANISEAAASKLSQKSSIIRTIRNIRNRAEKQPKETSKQSRKQTDAESEPEKPKPDAKMNKTELQAVVKYFFFKGLTPAAIKDEMNASLKDSAPTLWRISAWVAELKRERIASTYDVDGTPKSVTTDTIISDVRTTVLNNPRRKVREIAQIVGISVAHALHILRDILGMRNVSGEWSPRKRKRDKDDKIEKNEKHEDVDDAARELINEILKTDAITQQ